MQANALVHLREYLETVSIGRDSIVVQELLHAKTERTSWMIFEERQLLHR